MLRVAVPAEKKETQVLKSSRIEGMDKYYKMLKMGLPEGAVKLSMTKDGVTAEKARAFWGDDGGSDSVVPTQTNNSESSKVERAVEAFSPLGKPTFKMKMLRWTHMSAEESAGSELWTDVKKIALRNAEVC
jgi:hypothetical protein